jgi:hypothetical protein
MNMQERNELLVRLDERTAKLEEWTMNHDHAHLRYNIMAWGIALTAIVGLIVALLTH